MTEVRLYRNKRNANKYLEVHNDGHYHNSIRQFSLTFNGENYNRNYYGNKHLQRFYIKGLKELLEDYTEIQIFCKTINQ